MTKRKNVIFTLFLAFVVLTLAFLGLSNYQKVNAMQIFVDNDGENITLELEPSDTVLDVKEKIADKKGIKVDKQNIYFDSELLEDERTLADYNIQKESTLILKIKSPTNDKNFGVWILLTIILLLLIVLLVIFIIRKGRTRKTV